MNKSKRKYLSEFAVNLYSARWLMMTADQLASGGVMPPRELEVSKKSHIYLICKTPILSYCKDSFEYNGGVIKGKITYSVGGKKMKIPFSTKFPLLDGATKIGLSKYPHREIHSMNNVGEVVRYLPANALCISKGLHLENPELSNLEVLYVGQAFGDGSRSAQDRLKSHSTLQKILAEAQYNFPECVINILTFEYAPYRIFTQMGGKVNAAISDHRDIERYFSIVDNPLTEHQQICLIEASLIRYFQPYYNEIYKEKFPSKNHKILESCYKLDFSALIVEINTDDFGHSLFSERVKPANHHICKFDLVSHEDRWGFFHHFLSGDDSQKEPDVISGSE